MTGKRFTLIYGIDENPLEWDIMDNEKDVLICQWNGTPICDLLNELAEENEQLKQQLKKYKEPNCKKCIEYSQDGVADYCMSEDGLLGDSWKMFPFEWDYTNAKDCKEYEE